MRDIIDDDGTVRKHTVFDSYGRITGETFRDIDGDVISASHAEAIAQLFGYTGKPLDKVTGLQNNLHRWYDAAIGAFLSHDPIESDINSYRYAENKPATHIDPDGQSAIGKYVRRKIWMNASRQLRKRLAVKFGRELLRAHHIVTENIYNDPKLGKWLRDTLKLPKDAKCNLISLPTDEASRDALLKSGAMKTKRSIHPGDHLDEYMKGVRARIEDLFEQQRRGDISTLQARQGVEELQSELMQGLRNGTIALSHADRKRLLTGAVSIGGLVALSLSPEDQALAAEALTQLQMERAEAALNDPSHTKFGYLCAETYTGKDSWIGWGIDLFNPLADLMLIPEGASLLVQAFSDPEMNLFDPDDIEARMEQIRRQNAQP